MVNALTIFLSALLLFLVQPLIGKVILPWFGGGAAVWSAIVLFFQVLLLGGYAYSHFIVTRLDRRKQVAVHLSLVGLAMLWLAITAVMWGSPLRPDAAWKPPDSRYPIARILLVLTASVGLPYFVLSASGTLLQAWTGGEPAGKSPYRLYALSNLGSLLGLLGYPVLLEPALVVRAQAFLWSAGYAVFVAGMAIAGWRLWREARTAVERTAPPARDQEDPMPSPGTQLRPGRVVLWVVLPACATLLLVAVTSEMTLNVAPMPLLWVVPLAFYLLSFIVAFGRADWYRRDIFGTLFFIAATGSITVLARGNVTPLLLPLGMHTLTLFSACMICHGELVRLRPAPEHLTLFYLMVALGGALGSVFANLAAPILFANFLEYPLGVLLCWLLFLVAVSGDQSITPQLTQRFIGLGLIALLIAAFVTVSYVRAFDRSTVVALRSFYGGLRVQERAMEPPLGTSYRLVHGTTIHGLQSVGPARNIPTTYFGATSGVGMMLERFNQSADGYRMGVLGLGIGTLAAYGRSQDTLRFYEISPQVIRLAEGEGGYFHYLSECPATVDVIEGDARLSLEREPPQNFDILVLDVFSGDAMPVHLLTQEGFAVYLSHLAADGLLAVNISTTHVDLEPVLVRLADHFGLQGVVIEDSGGNLSCCRSRWALLAQDGALLADAAIAARARSLRDDARVRLWTDDYSNVWRILR